MWGKVVPPSVVGSIRMSIKVKELSRPDRNIFSNVPLVSTSLR